MAKNKNGMGTTPKRQREKEKLFLSFSLCLPVKDGKKLLVYCLIGLKQFNLCFFNKGFIIFPLTIKKCICFLHSFRYEAFCLCCHTYFLLVGYFGFSQYFAPCFA